jgi:hypothetical protein
MPSAVLFDFPGPPAVLRWRPVASLTPRPHEVVISVQAAGVNNADVLQRRGHYPVPPGAPRCAGAPPPSDARDGCRNAAKRPHRLRDHAGDGGVRFPAGPSLNQAV